MPWDEVRIFSSKFAELGESSNTQIDIFNISPVSRPAILIGLVKQFDFDNDNPTSHSEESSPGE
jgi:hypothetical protein